MNLKEIKKWWENTKDTWLGTIIYIILGFVIAYLFYHGLGILLNTDVPITAVFSESMKPVMHKGDMVFVKGSSEYNVGDIIVFDSPMFRYPIIHRIYSINGTQIKTKGDYNHNIDPWTITKNNIHGKAFLTIPYLGWVKVIFSEAVMLLSS